MCMYSCIPPVSRSTKVVWAVKHGHIGDAFFDKDAAQFLLEETQLQRSPKGTEHAPTAAATRSISNAPRPSPSRHSAVHVICNAPTTSRPRGLQNEPSRSALTSDRLAISSSLASDSTPLDSCRGASENPHGHAVGPRWGDAIRVSCAHLVYSLLWMTTRVLFLFYR